VARFATGVCVVSTVHDGLDHAMTANAFASVSLDPPLVLVCVDHQARFHEAIVTSGTWGVSVLDASAKGISTWLSTRGRPLQGQLDRAPHHRGAHTGVALLDQALSWLECRTEQIVAAGDHSIVVGRVLSSHLRPEEDEGALVFFRSAYRDIGV
jgi:flavin reductase (DIM6/NTAB) family NADH-FMN oxidoreductase RutF